jgi:hypothetical protein
MMFTLYFHTNFTDHATLYFCMDSKVKLYNEIMQTVVLSLLCFRIQVEAQSTYFAGNFRHKMMVKLGIISLWNL